MMVRVSRCETIDKSSIPGRTIPATSKNGIQSFLFGAEDKGWREDKADKLAFCAFGKYFNESSP